MVAKQSELEPELGSELPAGWVYDPTQACLHYSGDNPVTLESLQAFFSVSAKNLEFASDNMVVEILLDGNETTPAFAPVRKWFYRRNEKANGSWETLRNIIGPQRLTAISKRYGLSLDNKRIRGIAPTVGDLKKIFVGLADLCKADLERVSSHDHDHDDDSLMATLFKNAAEQNSLKPGTKGFVDAAFTYLVPFTDVKSIVCHQKFTVDPFVPDNGQTFMGHRQRVYLQESLRFSFENEKRAESLPQHTDWAIRVGKRIPDLDPPEGTLLWHPEGYYAVMAPIQGGGAYKIPCKPITESADLNPLILYRGTRPVTAKQGWQSLKEDLRPLIGSKGPLRTMDETNLLLMSEPFTQGRPVELIGNSIGGTHAQYDTYLFRDKVKRVTFIDSPGISENLAAEFAQDCQRVSGLPYQCEINFVRENDSIISEFGSTHLGAGVSSANVTRHYYAFSTQDDLPEIRVDVANGEQSALSKWTSFLLAPLKVIINLIHSLSSSHVRISAEQPYILQEKSLVGGLQDETEQQAINALFDNGAREQQSSALSTHSLEYTEFGEPDSPAAGYTKIPYSKGYYEAWRRVVTPACMMGKSEQSEKELHIAKDQLSAPKLQS